MSRRLSAPTLLARWAVGMGLVSWRYLWQTTPLHRSQQLVDEGDLPPDLDPDVDRTDLQPWTSGHGYVYHRVFRIRVADAGRDARGLMSGVLRGFEDFVPREVVRVHDHTDGPGPLRVNDVLVVDMPGPWNGPVRVAARDDRRLRLATLVGHLEAGQIEFRAHDDGADVVFEIEAWARPSSLSVDLLYARLRLAKEIQLNMWVRFCKSAARRAGGRLSDGIHITTVTGPAPSSAR